MSDALPRESEPKSDAGLNAGLVLARQRVTHNPAASRPAAGLTSLISVIKSISLIFHLWP